MLTLFLILSFRYLHNIVKVNDHYIFLLYNRKVDRDCVKVDKDLIPVVKRLPKTRFYYWLYHVYMHFMVKSKKNVFVSGEILPLSDMKRYRSFIEDYFTKKNVVFYKCFKIFAFFITDEPPIDLKPFEKIHHIKQTLAKTGNVVDSDDITYFEFKKEDVYKFIQERYGEEKEEVFEKEMIEVLQPLVQEYQKPRDNIIYMLILVNKIKSKVKE
ncbi:MAG TPA: hypothetical protein PLL08_02620 [Bacteroidales bacterium]|nr:hypothetical protein [Bacteroidales bacterium]HOS57967.1 hypothetical protein [Bacteroidales bacterium]HXK73787.1 hypothetical protein [Bacteroidales bacterium]